MEARMYYDLKLAAYREAKAQLVDKFYGEIKLWEVNSINNPLPTFPTHEEFVEEAAKIYSFIGE